MNVRADQLQRGDIFIGRGKVLNIKPADVPGHTRIAYVNEQGDTQAMSPPSDRVLTITRPAGVNS